MGRVWLDSFEIVGLWGSRNIERNISNPVNIMHGANGTGKTTIMSLLAATLSVNLKTLVDIDFKKVRITLKRIGNNTKPIVIVEKRAREGQFRFKYIVKNRSGDMDVEPISFFYDDMPRGYMKERRYDSFPTRAIRVRERISELVGFSWLTIDRGVQDARRGQSTVDQKITNLSRGFQRYCSRLDREQLELKEEFQRSVFLSFLTSQRIDSFIMGLSGIDFDKEEAALNDIYEHFLITGDEVKTKISNHYVETKEYLDAWMSDNSRFDFNKLFTLFDTSKIHKIIDAWSNQKVKIENVFKQRNLFFKIVDDLLHYKRLEFNSDYDLYAITDSNKKLSLYDLSSGEKQLLILLTESLIQDQEPWIYLADEPELSLHVQWQEKLIDCIRSVNPNSQVFFATHSPDIISHYGEYSFDLEKVLDDIM